MKTGKLPRSSFAHRLQPVPAPTNRLVARLPGPESPQHRPHLGDPDRWLGVEALTAATVRLVGRRARHQSWEHHSVELQARVTVRKRRRAVLGHRRDGVRPPLENAEHDERGRLNGGCPRSTVRARLSVRCEQVPWYVQGWVPIDD